MIRSTIACLACVALMGCGDKGGGAGTSSATATSTSAASSAPTGGAKTAAATATAESAPVSKSMQAAIASRKCRHPDETDEDRKFKAGADASELEKMKLSDAQLDCFINCKTKDDAEKCEAAAMKK